MLFRYTYFVCSYHAGAAMIMSQFWLMVEGFTHGGCEVESTKQQLEFGWNAIVSIGFHWFILIHILMLEKKPKVVARIINGE